MKRKCLPRAKSPPQLPRLPHRSLLENQDTRLYPNLDPSSCPSRSQSLCRLKLASLWRRFSSFFLRKNYFLFLEHDIRKTCSSPCLQAVSEAVQTCARRPLGRTRYAAEGAVATRSEFSLFRDSSSEIWSVKGLRSQSYSSWAKCARQDLGRAGSRRFADVSTLTEQGYRLCPLLRPRLRRIPELCSPYDEEVQTDIQTKHGGGGRTSKSGCTLGLMKIQKNLPISHVIHPSLQPTSRTRFPVNVPGGRRARRGSCTAAGRLL